jgi:DNA-binding transcriptional regulator YhcF (GntR family)
MLDVSLNFDRQGASPIYLQLADCLRGLIGNGRLDRGEKLPATRELASALGIGRNTAAQAYQILIDDGVLLSHVGQGTFVSSRNAAQPLISESELLGPKPFASP